MNLLEGKAAIITGAAQGIGLGIAKAFAEHGADVMMTDVQHEKVEVASQELASRTGRRILASKLDVTDKAQVEQVVERTVNELGRLDVMVNNAGIHLPNLIIDIRESEWDKVFDVNVKGSLLCSQAAARAMIEQAEGGCILIVSSASGKKPDTQGAAYCSSKSALIGLTRVLALELGEYGIRANAILPGATDTPMLRGLFEEVPGLKELLESRTPLKRMATPRDQANAAVFLASDLASHITGEQLVVSGGEFMET